MSTALLVRRRTSSALAWHIYAGGDSVSILKAMMTCDRESDAGSPCWVRLSVERGGMLHIRIAHKRSKTRSAVVSNILY